MNNIEAYHKREQDKQLLMGYCQKILKGIEEPVANSEQRAIWELVQNARDLSDECHIKIDLCNDRLDFSHQGKPFDNKTLFSLTIQSSSKDAEDAEQVGQYGTGFMTTHTFNTRVTINGTYDYTDENGVHQCYYPIDNFVLDRSGSTANEIFDEMCTALKKINNLHNTELSISEKRLWTTFSYDLDDKMAKNLNEQLAHLIKLIPFVLVINNRIKDFTISNHISNKRYRFCAIGNKVDAETLDNDWLRLSKQISVCNESEEKQIITCNYIQSSDDKDIIFIPPFDLYLGSPNDFPTLFLWFPLLGSENFGVNFIFHSSRFYPVEKRNNILLPRENDKHPEKYKNNEAVLNEMFDALFAYYRNPLHAQELPIECCKVHFPQLGNDDDQESKRYFDTLQEKWSKEMFSWSVIPIDRYGKLSLNDNRVRVLAPEFYVKLDDEKRKQYEPIMRHFATQVALSPYYLDKIILPKTDLIAWSERVAEWDSNGFGKYVTLKQVCEAIKENTSQLHDFLTWLKDIGQDSLFDEFALIPNREGALCKRGELRDAKSIPAQLYKIARPIIKTATDTFVDTDYADIYAFKEYTRTNLRDDISSAISSLRKKTICNTSYCNGRYITEPKLLPIEGIDIDDILSYCSAFTTDLPNSLRRRMIPNVCKLYGKAFSQLIVENEQRNADERSIDIYETCFNFLIEHTMLFISLQKNEWLIENNSTSENYNLLLKFVTDYAENAKTNLDSMERLKRYAIFPNQLYQLSKCDDLMKNTSVSHDFAELYNQIMNTEIESEWVIQDFQDLYEFEDVRPKTLGKEIEDCKCFPYLEEKRKDRDAFIINDSLERSMLTIINHLEKGEWTEYFDHFAKKENLRNISYELGTEAQKDALYRIKMGISNQHTLERIADIANNPNVDAILYNAEQAIKMAQEHQRQFNFTYAIGKMIEDEVREKISDELSIEYSKSLDEFVANDEQNGQDIVIRKNGEAICYIECKAKWNFNEPAHMSSQQIKQSVRHEDRYALLCVDCTSDGGAQINADASFDEIQTKRDEIFNHTKALIDISEYFKKTISPIVEHEDASIDEKAQIKIYSNITCNITKPIFTSGIPLDEFISILKNKITNI